MKRKIVWQRATRSAALGLAASCLTCAAYAGPNNVPFKASVATQEVLRYNDTTCPFQFGGKTTGTGTASHLGAITFMASDCITPGQGSLNFTQGVLTIYAANGDTLTGTYDGTLTVNPQPNTLSGLAGRFSVTGGTGRFAGASGSGYLQGSENLATGQGQFDLTGTLSY